MSTINSPPFTTPSSSRRASTDTTTRSQAASPARVPPQRRNRAALRDYYGLKTDAAAAADAPSSGAETDVKEGELDQEGFDAETYVRNLLANENLQHVLRVEGGLVNEIRGLDGERKALVYDNYSKLITATDTIRKMRSNMDPLAPTTSTLAPAISHISETATSLATTLQDGAASSVRTEPQPQYSGDKERQRKTAMWVLNSPKRLAALVKDEKSSQALGEWNMLAKWLQKWEDEGVKGADEVRHDCEQVLSGVWRKGLPP